MQEYLWSLSMQHNFERLLKNNEAASKTPAGQK